MEKKFFKRAAAAALLASSLEAGCLKYPDRDGDGAGDATAEGLPADSAPASYVDNAADCDDGNSAINPDALEIMGNVTDEDCDGVTPDILKSLYGKKELSALGNDVVARDLDGDGLAEVAATTGGDLPLVIQDVLTDTEEAYIFDANRLAAGDVDGDGYSDLVTVYTPSSESGGIYVWNSPLTGSYEKEDAGSVYDYDDSRSPYMGTAIADVNGDGSSEIFIGNGDNEVMVVFSDATTTTFSGRSGSAFGENVLPVDVTGDGNTSTVISAAYEERVCIFHDAETDTRIGDADTSIYGETDGQWFGGAVASDDFNGDGYNDLVIAAPEDSSVLPNAGKIYNILGPMTEDRLSVGASSAAITGEETGQAIGMYGGIAAGDVDGDGMPDLLIGASDYDSETDRSGGSYLVTNITDGSSSISEAATAVLNGDTDSLTGKTVRLGEINGDGLQDLVISSTLADHSYYTDSGDYITDDYTGRVDVIAGW